MFAPLTLIGFGLARFIAGPYIFRVATSVASDQI